MVGLSYLQHPCDMLNKASNLSELGLDARIYDPIVSDNHPGSRERAGKMSERRAVGSPNRKRLNAARIIAVRGRNA
jgi:hypothetical protein